VRFPSVVALVLVQERRNRARSVADGRCSYVTMMLPRDYSGSIASLRTFRVLRALKTVAVVPGERSARLLITGTTAIRLPFDCN